jgi:N utilization substance protein B
MSSRREARERTLQALYAFELGSGEARHVIQTVIKRSLKDDKDSIDFATSLFLRTIDFSQEADETLIEYTKNWELSRIALIDRLILRMAMCEMLTFQDIPPKVTINEAIEVAKRYSTAKSGQFVNGILDAVLMKYQRAGRLNKSGRGLIGMDSVKKRAAE